MSSAQSSHFRLDPPLLLANCTFSSEEVAALGALRILKDEDFLSSMSVIMIVLHSFQSYSLRRHVLVWPAPFPSTVPARIVLSVASYLVMETWRSWTSVDLMVVKICRCDDRAGISCLKRRGEIVTTVSTALCASNANGFFRVFWRLQRDGESSLNHKRKSLSLCLLKLAAISVKVALYSRSWSMICRTTCPSRYAVNESLSAWIFDRRAGDCTVGRRVQVPRVCSLLELGTSDVLAGATLCNDSLSHIRKFRSPSLLKLAATSATVALYPWTRSCVLICSTPYPARYAANENMSAWVFQCNVRACLLFEFRAGGELAGRIVRFDCLTGAISDSFWNGVRPYRCRHFKTVVSCVPMCPSEFSACRIWCSGISASDSSGTESLYRSLDGEFDIFPFWLSNLNGKMDNVGVRIGEFCLLHEICLRQRKIVKGLGCSLNRILVPIQRVRKWLMWWESTSNDELKCIVPLMPVTAFPRW